MKEKKKEDRVTLAVTREIKSALYDLQKYGESYSFVLARLLEANSITRERPVIEMGFQELTDEARVKHSQLDRLTIRTRELVNELKKRRNADKKEEKANKKELKRMVDNA